ncbi:Hypothetical protein PHPALM_15816 [Phytophthora palmivora]|uniref:Uncharacterized protein n=1 Tax=Phytophthora palmivora TaxID=4796 RepID=A0A2P4XRF1_9STRA|nr:Hypothetical protein PHPALM_15816 [Phytophthora palmivora]
MSTCSLLLFLLMMSYFCQFFTLLLRPKSLLILFLTLLQLFMCLLSLSLMLKAPLPCLLQHSPFLLKLLLPRLLQYPLFLLLSLALYPSSMFSLFYNPPLLK